MKVLFHSNQLGIRGTEIALYDYAAGNEDILGNESFIAAPITNDLTSLSKFQERFPGDILLYTHTDELQRLVDRENIDVVYQIISGEDTSLKLKNTKNVYHAVFNVKNPEITAYVSSWLSDQHPGSKWCPHIVSLPYVSEDYRPFLSIPHNATVVGRYGGFDQFNLPYLPEVIKAVVEQNPNIYFLLMNTRNLGFDHPRVIYIDGTTDEYMKAAFLNSLDLFFTGRADGESFGLSIAEACFYNIPVITNSDGRDKNHLRILGPEGYYYETAQELYAILTNFKRKDCDYRHLVTQFSSEKVMQQFNEIFLK